MVYELTRTAEGTRTLTCKGKAVTLTCGTPFPTHLTDQQAAAFSNTANVAIKKVAPKREKPSKTKKATANLAPPLPESLRKSAPKKKKDEV